MVTAWLLAASLIRYSFLNSSKTISCEKCAQQIIEMNQKLQCLQLTMVNRNGPILHHNNAQPHIIQARLKKLNKLGYEFCLIYHIYLHFHQLTTTSSGIWATFCRENVSLNSRRQKMLSYSLLKPKHVFLCYRNEQICFLQIKMC